MITVVDYRAGNLTSVKLAFEALGEQVEVTSDAATIKAAARVVFPGVGAAGSAMANLKALGLVEAVKEAAATKPFLGICLGMQILFEHSEEDGGVETLGVLPGKVRRFPDGTGWKVPEIGWNQVCGVIDGREAPPCGSATLAPITRCDLPEYYFVHSYYAEVCPYTTGITEYAGVKFTAMVQKGMLWACQFHPEKSGRIGLALLRNWLEVK